MRGVSARVQRRGAISSNTRQALPVRAVLEGLEERRLFSTAYALFGTAGTVLARFDTSTPGTIDSTQTVSGLPAGTQLRGIDFRPATGELYALGIKPTSGDDEGQIFKINTSTGAATQLGAAPFSTSLSSAAPYGFDFNPAVDRIRIFNGDDQNLRVNPNTGALVQFDTPLNNPANDEEVTGGAYDRNVNDVMPVGNPAALTTLFGIDFINDTLVRIGGVDGGAPEGSPNLGVVTEIGPLGLTTGSSANGFDIAQDGTAYAALTDSDSGLTSLYTIDLATGAATPVDAINNGAEIVRGFAIAPEDLPPVANPDTYAVAAGGSLTVNPRGVLSNDTDPDGDDNALTAERIANPSNGVLLFNSDGGFTYTPNPGFVGVDSFTYVANDGVSDSAPVTTVTLNVVPTVSVNDKAVTEGNSGEKDLTFTLTLSAPSASEVVVNYKTSNNTAGEGDYVVVPFGQVTFAVGETTKDVVVKVKGDTKVETDETFFLKLTGVTNASLGDASGTGTIVNDDGGSSPGNPKVFIGDANIFEGNSGTKNLVFNVTLDASSSKTITLSYATQNFTAGEGDYQVKSGTLTFSPGQTSKTITILIKGDTKLESDEQFRVNLSNLVNVQAGDLQALGTIRNDD